ncbi:MULTISPECIES: DUF6118 family protein [unclassified Phenylobacterium]|uniref:DUF6118 family protein n=1 Tax=unclassified Phenylobacterium TaxID=2640670 RepID=UPI00083B65F2|nr:MULTISPECIES: DUF6118 family protein [unclassified Phenylobacterium]
MADEDDADGEEAQDAAAVAFEQLRAEVAHVRAALEALGPVLRSVKAPDYSPTLGQIVQRLEAIESHPALKVTPDQHRWAVDRAAEAARRSVQQDVQEVFATVGRASSDIRRFAGELRTREQQGKALVYAAVGGLVAGAVLWVLLSGPIARALPASWRVPERMAAATLHLDRWEAGARLMETANPGAWGALVAASRLWRGNHDALDACARSAARAGRTQPCRVVVEANPAKR